MAKKIDILKHDLVPKHKILSDEEKAKLLKKLNISEFQLPSIKHNDPVIKAIGAKKGNVIQIKRNYKTTKSTFYRRVI